MTKNKTRVSRILFLVLIFGTLFLIGQFLSDSMLQLLEVGLRPSTQSVIHNIVVFVVGLYVLLLAVPFMPGMEIGLGLILMLGPSVCLLVYMATISALALAYGMGRLLPPTALLGVFEWLGFARAKNLVADIAPMSSEQRLMLLTARAPGRLIPFLLRHRYIALAVTINLPGNALIGGGGGISLLAGTSRLFTFPRFFLTVALAVSPVPLLYYFVGRSY